MSSESPVTHWIDRLKAGERLIVSGIQKIADGAPVKPVEKTGA